MGKQTYCAVSGAVFVVDEERPSRDRAGAKIWFCCEACAQYYDANTAEVARARGWS